MKKWTGKEKKAEPQNDRAWFEREVAEFGTELETLPEERQDNLNNDEEAGSREFASGSAKEQTKKALKKGTK